METALMSGTPVPIYVRKRSNSTSTKFFRTSSKKQKHSRKKSRDQRSSTSFGLPAPNSRPSSLENTENAPPPLDLLAAKSAPTTNPVRPSTTTILPSPPDSPPPHRKLPDIPAVPEHNNWPLASINQNNHINGANALTDSDAAANLLQSNQARALHAKARGRTKLVKSPPKTPSKSPVGENLPLPADTVRGPSGPIRISSPISASTSVWSAPEVKPPKSPPPVKVSKPTKDTHISFWPAPAPPATVTTPAAPAPIPPAKSQRRHSLIVEPPPRSPTRPKSIRFSGDEAGALSGLEGGKMNQYIQTNGSSQLNPAATYQHIQDMAAKRMSTLDYLRKTHEGRLYLFNTLLFSRSDITRLPSFDPKKLAKRAANLLLLGLSLPSILDLNNLGALDFLRALNALLVEFEAYQQVHPSDGTGASSLSRARMPQIFKRSATAKARRTSSAADIGLPFDNSDPSDAKSMIGGSNAAAAASTISLAASDDLLPGEEYSYLVTPSLPFDPDFFEVFAALCDVLIDCYMRITSLVSSPDKCVPGVAEIFAKTDARLRKVIVAGIVKEFEDATRVGVKGEVAGIGKVVLGGLM